MPKAVQDGGRHGCSLSCAPLVWCEIESRAELSVTSSRQFQHAGADCFQGRLQRLRDGERLALALGGASEVLSSQSFYEAHMFRLCPDYAIGRCRVLAALGFAAMYVLGTMVEPDPREISMPIPAGHPRLRGPSPPMSG